MKRWLMILPLAVVLSGCGLGGNNQAAVDEATDTGEAQVQPGESFSGTLKAAALMGVPMKCTYTMPNGMEAEGTIKGKMYKGTMMAEGKTVTVIMKDTCMWTWEAGNTQGIQTCFDPGEADEAMWESEEATDENITYSCMPTLVSDADFEPPAGVSFLNINDMMGGQMSEEQLQQLQQMGE
jgi:hypothetical protein